MPSRKLRRRQSSGAIAELLDYRKAGPGTLPRLMARADVVLCTENSSTMISEAIAARLPVVGIAPRQHSFKPEEADYRALMIARGWARFVPLAEMTPDRLLTELAQVKPLAENHLVSLAQTLSERLPGLVDGSGVSVPCVRHPSDHAANAQAGAGPNTSATLRPPNANEFDMT